MVDVDNAINTLVRLLIQNIKIPQSFKTSITYGPAYVIIRGGVSSGAITYISGSFSPNLY